MKRQHLISGFVRLCVLHDAAEGDSHGPWMIEELARHGYKATAGTLYPMLRSIEKEAAWSRAGSGLGARIAGYVTPYRAPAVAMVSQKAKELFREVIGGGNS